MSGRKGRPSVAVSLPGHSNVPFGDIPGEYPKGTWGSVQEHQPGHKHKLDLVCRSRDCRHSGRFLQSWVDPEGSAGLHVLDRAQACMVSQVALLCRSTGRVDKGSLNILTRKRYGFYLNRDDTPFPTDYLETVTMQTVRVNQVAREVGFS